MSLPTYQYACTECGRDLEAVQSFTDEALTECPTCHGRLRKVFGAVGIVFKGSGFYRNDSRDKKPSDEVPAKVDAKTDGKPEAKSADSPKSTPGTSSTPGKDGGAAKPAASMPVRSGSSPSSGSSTKDSAA